MLANPGTHTGGKVSEKGLRTSQADQKRAGVTYINHWLILSTPDSVPSAHKTTWLSSFTSLVTALPSFSLCRSCHWLSWQRSQALLLSLLALHVGL